MILSHVLQRSSTSNNDVSFHTAVASPVRTSADARVKSHKAVSSAGLQAVVPAGHVGSEAFTSDLQTEGLRTSLRSTPKSSFAILGFGT